MQYLRLVFQQRRIQQRSRTLARQLEHAAMRLRQAPPELQFETWRRWTRIVQRAFRAADDVWTLLVPVLADSRGAKGSFWRRILRRSGSGSGK